MVLKVTTCAVVYGPAGGVKVGGTTTEPGTTMVIGVLRGYAKSCSYSCFRTG